MTTQTTLGQIRPNQSKNIIKLISVNKFRHDGVSHLTSLPFVKVIKKAEALGNAALEFDIEITGDSAIDANIGRSYAELIIKAAKDDGLREFSPIRDLLFSLLGKHEEISALSGFISGFAGSMDYWVVKAAADHGDQLEADSYEQILGRIKHLIEQATSGEIHPTITQQPEAVSAFLDQIAAFETERQAATEAGVPALIRLADVAERDTGQATTIRSFLLGLYNGYCFPFNLTTLRGIDRELFTDCLAVLTMDARATVKEVHQYFDNGSQMFERWARGVKS